MSGHTPGPWSVDGIAIKDEFSKAVALAVPRSMEHFTYGNARLIAAAPELLSELQSASVQMNMAADCIEAGRYDEALMHVRSMARNRRAVIAKATGEIA